MRLAFLMAVLIPRPRPSARAQDPAAIQEVISEQIDALRARRFCHRLHLRLAGHPADVRQPRPVRGDGARRLSDGPAPARRALLAPSSRVPADGRTLQGVLVTDEAGALHVLEYEMVPMDAHGWRIDGVRLRQAGTGA